MVGAHFENIFWGGEGEEQRVLKFQPKTVFKYYYGDYWLITNWVRTPTVPMHLGLKNGPFVPDNMIPVQGIPVSLLKFQFAPKLKLLTFRNLASYI